MMRNIKMRVAAKIKGFLDYWSLQSDRQHVDPSVGVLNGTAVYSGVEVGRYTYIGANSFVISGKIGSFCSISSNVVIGPDDHSMNAVSTHPFWSSPSGWTFEAAEKHGTFIQPKRVPIIGNDVWIGANAVILRGATVGDGAVIGAGAIVTRHIPAYGIAVGVPARVIRYRFEPEVRERLRCTRWWEWDDERLGQIRPLFENVDAFLQSVDLGASPAQGSSGSGEQEYVEVSS